MKPFSLLTRVRKAVGFVLFFVSLLLSINGCALHPGIVRHSFEFHAATDSPDIEVLNFRYGDSKQPGATASPELVERGDTFKGGGVSGDMRQGFDLYVKWRIKATGEVLEETADLRPRMPRDITDHAIYFIVRKRQLWVYLITPDRQIPPNKSPLVRG